MEYQIKLTAKGEKELRSRILDAVADAIFTQSQENLIEFDKVDTGFLLRSGNIERSMKGRKIVYAAPYATAVEFGSPPHTVGFHKILGWVKRKLGVSNDKEAAHIASRIVRKIERVGTPPTPFVRDAISMVKNNPKIIQRYLR